MPAFVWTGDGFPQLAVCCGVHVVVLSALPSSVGSYRAAPSQLRVHWGISNPTEARELLTPTHARRDAVAALTASTVCGSYGWVLCCAAAMPHPISAVIWAGNHVWTSYGAPSTTNAATLQYFSRVRSVIVPSRSTELASHPSQLIRSSPHPATFDGPWKADGEYVVVVVVVVFARLGCSST